MDNTQEYVCSRCGGEMAVKEDHHDPLVCIANNLGRVAEELNEIRWKLDDGFDSIFDAVSSQ
ncbi:MAG: hypothetical protein ABIE42_05780 [Candidatus Eisenbacteria bacterium]